MFIDIIRFGIEDGVLVIEIFNINDVALFAFNIVLIPLHIYLEVLFVPIINTFPEED